MPKMELTDNEVLLLQAFRGCIEDIVSELTGEEGEGEEEETLTLEYATSLSLRELRDLASRLGYEGLPKKNDILDWVKENEGLPLDDEEETEDGEDEDEESEDEEEELREELAQLPRAKLIARLRESEDGARISKKESDEDLIDRIVVLEMEEEDEEGDDEDEEDEEDDDEEDVVTDEELLNNKTKWTTPALLELAKEHKLRVSPPHRKPENRDKFAAYIVKHITESSEE